MAGDQDEWCSLDRSSSAFEEASPLLTARQSKQLFLQINIKKAPMLVADSEHTHKQFMNMPKLTLKIIVQEPAASVA